MDDDAEEIIGKYYALGDSDFAVSLADM